MAIGKAHVFKGITLNDAYHRIDWMNVNGLGSTTPTVEVQVGTYATQAEAVSPANAIERRSFVIEASKAQVSFSKCYVELAKLEAFAGGAEV